MLTKGLGRGGTERLLVGAVRHLDPSRYRVEVAYLLPWKDALVDEIRHDGVPVHCLDAPHPTSVAWIGRLRQLVRSHDIAIVHTHMPSPAVAARLALESPPAGDRAHRAQPVGPLPAGHALGEPARPTAATAPSSPCRTASPRRSGRGCRSTSCSTASRRDRARRDAAARAAARALLGLGADEPVIGTVGNLTAKKDHATLLRAVALVRERGPRRPPRARRVGAARGRAAPPRRRRSGSTDSVVLAGSRGDVPELLPAFDVFALSSRFEGLPIALLEAMATGLACVATTVGGIPEVVTDGRDGVLVEPADPAGLADALVALLDDPVRREELGRNAAAGRATSRSPARCATSSASTTRPSGDAEHARLQRRRRRAHQATAVIGVVLVLAYLVRPRLGDGQRVVRHLGGDGRRPGARRRQHPDPRPGRSRRSRPGRWRRSSSPRSPPRWSAPSSATP